MHIPDGMVTLQVSVATIAASASFFILTSSRFKDYLNTNNILKYSLTAMLIFSLQMININVTHGTSGHFLGAAFAAFLFGPYIGVLIMSSVLLTQALFFADGGYLAIGSNIFNMGIVGCFSAYYLYKYLSSKLSPSLFSRFASTAIASWFSVVMASVACSIELSFSNTAYVSEIFSNMLGIHNLIGVMEAATTTILLAVLYGFDRKILIEEKQDF